MVGRLATVRVRLPDVYMIVRAFGILRKSGDAKVAINIRFFCGVTARLCIFIEAMGKFLGKSGAAMKMHLI